MRLPLGVAVCVLAALLLAPASDAQASFQLGFDRITSNSSSNVAAQLSVDVSDPGSNQVLFTFLNAGPLASSITDVYFDDGSLLGIASIDNSDPGVSFTQPATPSNLPGASNASPPFVTTTNFSADSDTPVQANGVNPGESLGILFDLIGGGTFADVSNELDDGTLRIGLHVQGLPDGASDSFVNDGEPPPLAVPEPSSLAIWGLGMLAAGLCLLRRRRSTA